MEPPIRKRSLLRRAVTFSLFLFTVASGYALYWFWANVVSVLPQDLTHLRDYRPPTTCAIEASDGTKIDEFYLERRVWVPITELPDVAWKAFVSAEDRRFLTHYGIDPAGILRAMIKNTLSQSVRQGGSTITQQLVKNLLVGNERSYIRKLREAVLAIRLERELTKSQLLELYVNYIYLGDGNYGVEAASRDYFGVSAREIHAGQAATLAGLVRAPSRYSPRDNPEAALIRRGYVLGRMVEDGYLTAEEVPVLRDSTEVVTHRESGRRSVGLAYISEVRREIRKLFGFSVAVEHGFHIRTAMDLELQEHAEHALRESLEAIDERHGRPGAIEFIEPENREAFLARAEGLQRISATKTQAPRRGDCFKALVGEGGLADLRAGEREFWLYPDQYDTVVRGRGERRRKLVDDVRPGDVVRVCVAGGTTVELDPRPWAEGAAIVMENSTGRILAMVGGYSDTLEGFVRATQARRQPGSSFKPYVYASALLAGQTQLDYVYDGPISLPAGNGKWWRPRNFTKGYSGNITMRRALQRSLNTVSVRLTQAAGPRRVIDIARSLGVRTPLPSNLTISLGSGDVTPLDQTLGYSTIARLGVPAEPVFIDSIRDVYGRLIGEAGEQAKIGGELLARLPGGDLPRAIPAGVAYELTDMLRQVVRGGTGRSAFVEGFDRAGKTGTTNDFVDAWFVGFTPRHTITVWVGADSHASLGRSETGGRAAIPAWKSIAEALPAVEGERFRVPDEAVLVPVSGEWVGFPRGDVPARILAVPPPTPAPLPAFPAPST